MLTLLLLTEAERRIVDESFTRIEKCLLLLNDEQIWHRPNSQLASVGNLVLHVCGNARQWLLSGLFQHEDTRNRQAEFDFDGPMPRFELLDMLRKTKAEVKAAIQQIRTEQLLRTHAVQVFIETGVAILIHVIEHMSYHTGQISLHTKLLLDVDLGYYPIELS